MAIAQLTETSAQTVQSLQDTNQTTEHLNDTAQIQILKRISCYLSGMVIVNLNFTFYVSYDKFGIFQGQV